MEFPMSQQPTLEPQWITVADFASHHGLGKTLVYQQVRDPTGPLITVRIGGKILVRSDSFDVASQLRSEAIDSTRKETL